MDIDFLLEPRITDEAHSAISVTANFNGFTPLWAIARAYHWDSDLIKAAAEECNKKCEVMILTELNPIVILVPKTKAEKNITTIFKDLVDAANILDIKKLHFTHYSYMKSKKPLNEIKQILKILLDPSLHTSIKTVYWDLNADFKDDVIKTYKEVLLSL